MFNRIRWLSCAALLATSGAAQATEGIGTSFSGPEEKDGETISEVMFLTEDCEEECHVASLTCNQNRTIRFIFADVESTVLAKAITSEKQEIEVVAAGKSYNFAIEKMQFSELTGTWWVDGHMFANPLEFLPALAATKAFEVRLQELKLDLPVTDDVKTWATGCAK